MQSGASCGFTEIFGSLLLQWWPAFNMLFPKGEEVFLPSAPSCQGEAMPGHTHYRLDMVYVQSDLIICFMQVCATIVIITTSNWSSMQPSHIFKEKLNYKKCVGNFFFLAQSGRTFFLALPPQIYLLFLYGFKWFELSQTTLISTVHLSIQKKGQPNYECIA